MSRSRSDRPCFALVLSGGGARAAFQVGVLSAVAELFPEVEIKIKTGVSAGAINASYLAASRAPFCVATEGLRTEWARLTADRVFRFRSAGALPTLARGVGHFLSGRKSGDPAVKGLFDMSPLRGFLADCIDFGGISENVADGTVRALALSATDYATGFTETFIHGSPDLAMWRRARRLSTRQDITVDHVMASAAIPLIFAAVKVNGRYYGDGSLRQAAPLAPAIHLGADRILAISMRAEPDAAPARQPVEYPSAGQISGVLFNSIFLDALDTDAERLDRLNEVLDRIQGECRPPDGLRHIELTTIRPSRDLGAIARNVDVEFPGWISFFLRSMGGTREQSSDFLSYLMFDPKYTGPLIELGYEDGMNSREDLQRFFE